MITVKLFRPMELKSFIKKMHGVSHLAMSYIIFIVKSLMNLLNGPMSISEKVWILFEVKIRKSHLICPRLRMKI